jgi:isopentenyl phosphate kinase
MIFLKLGGSLITFKDQPDTARLEVLERLAGEVAGARRGQPELAILIGHGSGSFGHVAAARQRTHLGGDNWLGFAEVWRAANHLHRLVIDALIAAGLPALSFPPSASAIARSGTPIQLAVEPIRRSLEAGLVPVVQGDVAFDEVQGTTILSTEAVFEFLVPRLLPDRVLLAGIEGGVYRDFPRNSLLAEIVTEADLQGPSLASSAATDVTGGMADKVRHALSMAAARPGIDVRIFSAEEPGSLRSALLGSTPGTRVVATPIEGPLGK